MAHILDILSSKYKQYYFIITTGFVFVLFLLISIYLYNKFIKTNNTKENKFKDVANTGNNNREINLIMCHVDWCPHCKKALPEWKAFCDQYNNTEMNGYTITCNSEGTNCTDDSDPKIKTIISDFNIVSYPTVILMKDKKRYDFDAKITSQNLAQFIKSVSM